MKGIHILMDGNNTAYRANCVTELYTKSGIRTSAIVGVLNITHSVINQLNKLYDLPVKEVIYGWDRGHSQRRKDIFPDYKGNRKSVEKTPEEKQWMQEFIEQANILYDKLPLFGVKCIRKTGWEGDDIIYGLSQSLNELYPEDKIVIVSTDEDFHQLIGENIDLYSPIKQILYSLENYEELMGISQDLFLTYKILKGDSSDGIGGIPGIGEKTAKSLVNQYGNLEKLLSKDSKDKLMKSKRTQKIFTPEGLQILSRNNQLINLKDYVDLNEIKEEIEETLNKEPFVDTKIAKDFLMKYQITSILVKWKQWIETFEECTNNYLN